MTDHAPQDDHRAASRSLAPITVMAAGLVLAAPADAWAYIDAGTGSIAYQLLLAGLLAAGMLFRQILAVIRGWFTWTGASAPPDNKRTPIVQ